MPATTGSGHQDGAATAAGPEVAGPPDPPVEGPARRARLMAMRERLLAGLSASLLVLGVTSAVSLAPSDGSARQVAAGPVTTLAPVEETTTTTEAPVTETTEVTTVAEEPLAPLGPPPSRPAGPSVVATAVVASVGIYAAPGGQPTRELANPQPSGAPLVMLVRDQQPGWVRVLLPVRPNGASGWVRRDQVALATTDFYMVIGLAEHRITVFNGNSIVLDERIGLGAGGTPTPTGLFFIKELLQPPNPAGPYGPFAYGLSAFSDVLFSFGGGPGTVGVHGTNDPSSLGRNVSNGCIRMSNSGVTRLARMLPLGVPVRIS